MNLECGNVINVEMWKCERLIFEDKADNLLLKDRPFAVPHFHIYRISTFPHF